MKAMTSQKLAKQGPTADDSAAVKKLSSIRDGKTQKEVAHLLGVNTRTVRRWENGQHAPRQHTAHALQGHLDIAPPRSCAKQNAKFSFIDLFAGIGGMRHAFEGIGGQCVFTSEWDSFAQTTYSTNFTKTHILAGDITQIDAEAIPAHDVLLAGFPCQPFSIAGVSKKNSLGKAHGFACDTQGTLFFDVARIIEAKQPKAFLLENVKNLLSHDKGRTFDVIRRTLAEELGYHIQYRVIDGAHFVPQHRERILIVGFKDGTDFNFDAIDLPPKGIHTLAEILHRTDGSEPFLELDGDRFFDRQSKRVQPKFTLTDNLWLYLQNYAAKHRAQGNGFGFGLTHPEGVARTLSARYYKDGSEILIYQGKNNNPRRLTPRECARLMGFPDSFQIPVSDTRAYKQFGNSVVVHVMAHVAQLMLPFLTVEKRTPAKSHTKA
jgi:DNA (cytosine-5)-methyltransferase 1